MKVAKTSRGLQHTYGLDVTTTGYLSRGTFSHGTQGTFSPDTSQVCWRTSRVSADMKWYLMCPNWFWYIPWVRNRYDCSKMISDMETLELKLPPPITCCDPCDSPDDSGSEYDLPDSYVPLLEALSTRACNCSAQCIDLFNAVPFKVQQLLEMHSVFEKKTREAQNNMLFQLIKKHYDKDWGSHYIKNILLVMHLLPIILEWSDLTHCGATPLDFQLMGSNGCIFLNHRSHILTYSDQGQIQQATSGLHSLRTIEFAAQFSGRFPGLWWRRVILLCNFLPGQAPESIVICKITMIMKLLL